MNKIAGVFIFALGAAAGSVVTWKYAKREFEKAVREVVADVKSKYSYKKSADDKNKEAESDDPEPECIREARVKEEYASILNDSGYTNYSKVKQEEKKESEPVKEDRPYVIAPEEFDEVDDYGIESLTYYADGVVATDADEALEEEEIEYLIGTDSLTHFGEYEDDSVYVRNDATKCDYEILRDCRNFTDVKKKDHSPDTEA